MITDNTIDDANARYWCVFADGKFEKILADAKVYAKIEDLEKDAINVCLKMQKDYTGKTDQLNENWLTDILKADPAWVEEPTGFNRTDPVNVFKNNTEGGLDGYRKGTMLGALTVPVIIAPEKTVKAVKAVAKTIAKHPVASAEAATLVAAAKELHDHGWLDDVLDWCKSICGFVKDHPVAIGTIGSIAYGLLKTYSLWKPYVKRLYYNITSGKVLAKCEFESNGSSYRFEYSLGKNKWILLQGGTISQEIYGFIQTDFARRFIERCRQIIEPVLKNDAATIKAMAGGIGDTKVRDLIYQVFDDTENIRNNMFKMKIMAESANNKNLAEASTTKNHYIWSKLNLKVKTFSKHELDWMVKQLGTTDNFQDAGWILPDGRMLNMHRTEETYYDDNDNRRYMDGRLADDVQRYEHDCIPLPPERDDEVNELGVMPMQYLLAAGFVRIDGAESATVSCLKHPTPEQMNRLYDFAELPWDTMRDFYQHRVGITQFAADIYQTSIVYDDIDDFRRRLMNDIKNYSK